MIDEAGRTEKDWMEYARKLRHGDSAVEDFYLERESKGLVGVMSPGGHGGIPILYARGTGLAEAWENSLITLAARGGFVRTQYDQRGPNGLYLSPPSLDSTMNLIVEDPLAEPMIHRSFPGGFNDLEEYRQEVLDGIKDHWVRDQNDPNDQRWEYTYHERLFSYAVPGVEGKIDQVAAMIQNLSNSPITRRANVISWKPWEDLNIGDPACFQSLWGRVLRDNPEFEFYSDEETGEYNANFNMRFRSRDAYEAAFMNDFAFIHLIQRIAQGVSANLGEEVKLKRFLDGSDSYHVYGKMLDDFQNRFLNSLSKRTFEERTFRLEDAKEIFEEAKPIIAAKVKRQDENYAARLAKGEELTKE